MSKRLAKLEQQKAETIAAMRAATAEADKDGGFTPEEDTAYQALESKLTGLKAQIDREKTLIEEERAAPAINRVSSGGTPNTDRDPAKGFRSHRDFLVAVMANADARNAEQLSDDRLKPLAVTGDEKESRGRLAYLLPSAYAPIKAAVGSDEHNASQDAFGGLSVREQMLPGMLQVDPEADPTAGRTQPIPMEAPSVKILARVDKDHSSSVSGGLTVARRAEMAAFASSRMSMERIILNAAMLAGLAYETEELLSDSMLSFAAVIAAGFRTEFPAAKLNEKIRGTGGDQYLGILTALASASLGPTISIAKESGQAADTINATNIIKMRARCWGFGNAIWLANHDTYPQLRQMAVAVGTGGQLVYQPSLVEGRPDTLEGRPIFYTEFANTVGDQGDLILANWSQYLEGTYQPLQSASSIHVRFETHEQTFKFWERNAGAPWWRTALTPKRGSNTLSPFVVLDARA